MLAHKMNPFMWYFVVDTFIFAVVESQQRYIEARIFRKNFCMFSVFLMEHTFCGSTSTLTLKYHQIYERVLECYLNYFIHLFNIPTLFQCLIFIRHIEIWLGKFVT